MVSGKHPDPPNLKKKNDRGGRARKDSAWMEAHGSQRGLEQDLAPGGKKKKIVDQHGG